MLELVGLLTLMIGVTAPFRGPAFDIPGLIPLTLLGSLLVDLRLGRRRRQHPGGRPAAGADLQCRHHRPVRLRYPRARHRVATPRDTLDPAAELGRSAALAACFGLLVCAIVSAALVELSLVFYAFMGLASAVTRRWTVRADLPAGPPRQRDSLAIPAQ